MIVSDDTKYVKLLFLNDLFPAIFPLEKNVCLNANDRQKIRTFLIKQYAGNLHRLKYAKKIADTRYTP